MKSGPMAYSYTRFSSERQRHGDSVRRQLEAVEEWCKQEGGGLALDTSLRDEGVPGYMGRNAKVGALARFLKAIEAGMIAPGSILVVENLDRLSRNEPLEGLDLLKTIIKAGVEIVTLHDRRRYTRENLSRDVVFLINALLILARGYEESDTKSKRLAASWQNKRRAAAQGRVFSSWIHPWLRVVGARKLGTRTDFSDAKIVPIEERAQTVRQIFNWAIGGMGYETIAKELRTRKVKPWNRAGWSRTRIQKIIRNRAVLGEYQPHRYEGGSYGKRVPDGDPIKDYYPRIVTDDVFERAQPTVTGNPGGRQGRWVRLLTGLVVDPRDRRMHVYAQAQNKYFFYGTDKNLLGAKEKMVRWSGEHLERSVVAACQGIDWERLFSLHSDTGARDRLDAQVTNLTREEAVINGKLTKAAETLLNEPGAFGDALRKQAKQLESRLAELRAERATARSDLEDVRRRSESIPSLAARQVPDDPTERHKLRTELRRVLTKIQIWPDGRTSDKFWKPVLEQAIEAAPKRAYKERADCELIGALRFFFANGREITAYVTFHKEGKHREARVLAYAKPHGMSATEWADIRAHARLGESGGDTGSTSRAPTLPRAALKR
ncbi:MAG TPA: recombinase family protein [Opitutaceae bacterium]|nr:recombinase family protein [Opitutaceae bacterium]